MDNENEIAKTVEWARGTPPPPEPVLDFKELPVSETYPKRAE